MELKFKNQKGINYTVKFKKPDGRTWKSSTDGVCFFPRGLLNEGHVEVNPHRTDQTIFNTVIHEVTHAFFEDKTETEVTKFANTLSRLLFNNLQFKNEDLKRLLKEN